MRTNGTTVVLPEAASPSASSDAMDRVLRTLGYDPNDAHTHLPMSSRGHHRATPLHHRLPWDVGVRGTEGDVVQRDSGPGSSPTASTPGSRAPMLRVQDLLDAALPRALSVQKAMALVQVPFRRYTVAVCRQQRRKIDAVRCGAMVKQAAAAKKRVVDDGNDTDATHCQHVATHSDATEALLLLQWTVRRFVVRWWAYLYLAAILQQQHPLPTGTERPSTLPLSLSLGDKKKAAHRSMVQMVAKALPQLLLGRPGYSSRTLRGRRRRKSLIGQLKGDAAITDEAGQLQQCLVHASNLVAKEVALLAQWSSSNGSIPSAAAAARRAKKNHRRCSRSPRSPIAAHAALVHKEVQRLAQQVSLPAPPRSSPAAKAAERSTAPSGFVSKALANALLVVCGSRIDAGHVLEAIAVPATKTNTPTALHGPSAVASLDQLVPLLEHRLPEVLRAEVHNGLHRGGDGDGGTAVPTFSHRSRSGVRNGQVSFDELAHRLSTAAAAGHAVPGTDRGALTAATPTQRAADVPTTLTALVEAAAVWRYQQHIHHSGLTPSGGSEPGRHPASGPIGWLLHPFPQTNTPRTDGIGAADNGDAALDVWSALLPAACWSSRGAFHIRHTQHLLHVAARRGGGAWTPNPWSYGRPPQTPPHRDNSLATACRLVQAEGKLLDRQALRAAARRFLKFIYC